MMVPTVVIGVIAVGVFLIYFVFTHPKLRRWAVRFCVVAAIVGVVAVVTVVGYLMRLQADSANRIKALQARGVPANAQEIDDYYVLPDGQVDRTEEWQIALAEADSIKLVGTKYEDLSVDDAGSDDGQQNNNGRQQAELLDDFFHEHRESIEWVREIALAGGHARFPVSYVPNALEVDTPHLRSLSSVCRVLRIAALWHARHGEQKLLGQDLVALLNLVEVNKYEPTVISCVMQYSILSSWFDCFEHTKRLCPLNDERCVQLQKLLNSIDVRWMCERAMHGERATALDAMQTLSEQNSLL